MSLLGIGVGAVVFLIIGILHPVVIKCEYYFGKGCWPAFALLGVACCAGSLWIPDLIGSIVLAVLGFSLFWSIQELFAQERRVRRGWFPQNPKRKGRTQDRGIRSELEK